MFHNLCYFSCSCTSTYPIVNDRWGTTDIATLSLHLILFSASLTALQNFNPVHSEILFSQLFFCWPLLLPPCTVPSVPCKVVFASPDDLDTFPNHFNLRFFTVVKISSGPMACLILSLTASLVMWSRYENIANFFRMSTVNVQVLWVYNSTEIQGSALVRSLSSRYAYHSRWSWVSLVLLLSVQFWTVLQAWNHDLWWLHPDPWSCQPRPIFHRWFWCQCWYHSRHWSSVWSSLHWFPCQRL